MKIKAAISSVPQKPLEIQSVQLGEPKANEVLVKIASSGICHTDAVGRDGSTTPHPVALGHEGSGIVEKVGSDVTSIAVGDHVVLSFSYCSECNNCRHNHPGMCERFNELNFSGINFDGSHRLSTENGQDISTFFGQSSFATHVVADEHNVVKVNPEVDINLLGTLGCGIQTGAGTVLNYLKPTAEDTIAVFGVGAVGLSAVMAAKLVGMKHIIAINRNGNHLALAKKLGATEVIDNSTEDTEEAIRRIVPQGVTYAIDTTGNSGVILSAVHSLAPAGECVLVGVGGEITLNLMTDLLMESKKISGVVEGDSEPQKFIPELVNYYQEGRFPIDKLVKFYQFDEINQAFDDSAKGQVIKPIVQINPNLD